MHSVCMAGSEAERRRLGSLSALFGRPIELIARGSSSAGVSSGRARGELWEGGREGEVKGVLGGLMPWFLEDKGSGRSELWRHKDKSGYGSKTQDDVRSGALSKTTIHKPYQQQISDNYALASHRSTRMGKRRKNIVQHAHIKARDPRGTH